jgi:hypothetical protein
MRFSRQYCERYSGVFDAFLTADFRVSFANFDKLNKAAKRIYTGIFSAFHENRKALQEAYLCLPRVSFVFSNTFSWVKSFINVKRLDKIEQIHNYYQ